MVGTQKKKKVGTQKKTNLIQAHGENVYFLKERCLIGQKAFILRVNKSNSF